MRWPIATGMDRALTKIRKRLPPEAFLLTAACAPIRWKSVLQPLTFEKVGAMLKDNILQHGEAWQRGGGDGDCHDGEASKVKAHWLQEYIKFGADQALTISLFTLAEAVSPYVRSFLQSLDSDAVCALFMLRRCDVSRPYDALDPNHVNDDGGEEYMRCTPLYAAVETGKLDLVRLFLSGGAIATGFQSLVFEGEEGETTQTPLYKATCLEHVSMVAYLLEAHADPNDLGILRDRCGEDVHPEGGQHHDEETPLWHVTARACESNPTNRRGLRRREILRLLLKHGADPNKKGKCEHFFGVGSDNDPDSVRTYVRSYVPRYLRTYVRTHMHTKVRTYKRTYVSTYVRTCMGRESDLTERDEGWDVLRLKDEMGTRHTGDSQTTPFQYAKQCMNQLGKKCKKCTTSWATDVYKALELAAGVAGAS